MTRATCYILSVDRATNMFSRSIVGPMIGGALAKPVENLPAFFSPGSIWDRFPYLLPNLFSAICVFIGLFIGILFLEETHAEKRFQRDRGLELGNYLLARLSRLSSKRVRSTNGKAPEEQPLLFETDEPLPGYLTTETSTSRNLSNMTNTTGRDSLDLEASPSQGSRGRPIKSEKKPGKILTRSILLIIASYGILALYVLQSCPPLCRKLTNLKPHHDIRRPPSCFPQYRHSRRPENHVAASQIRRWIRIRHQNHWAGALCSRDIFHDIDDFPVSAHHDKTRSAPALPIRLCRLPSALPHHPVYRPPSRKSSHGGSLRLDCLEMHVCHSGVSKQRHPPDQLGANHPLLGDDQRRGGLDGQPCPRLRSHDIRTSLHHGAGERLLGPRVVGHGVGDHCGRIYQL